MTTKIDVFKIYDLLISIIIVVIFPAIVVLGLGKTDINNWIIIFFVSLSIPWFYLSNKPKSILNSISSDILNLVEYLDKNGAFTSQNYKCSYLTRITSIVVIIAFLVITDQILKNTNLIIDRAVILPLYYYLGLSIVYIFAGSVALILYFSGGLMGSYKQRKDHVKYLIDVSYKPKSLYFFLWHLTAYWVLSICSYTAGWKPKYATAQWIYNKKQERKKKVSQQKIDQLVKDCLEKKTYQSSHNNQVYHFYQNNQEVNTAEIVKYLEEIQNIEYTTKTIRARVVKSLNSLNFKT